MLNVWKMNVFIYCIGLLFSLFTSSSFRRLLFGFKQAWHFSSHHILLNFKWLQIVADWEAAGLYMIKHKTISDGIGTGTLTETLRLDCSDSV